MQQQNHFYLKIVGFFHLESILIIAFSCISGDLFVHLKNLQYIFSVILKWPVKLQAGIYTCITVYVLIVVFVSLAFIWHLG